MPSSAPSLRQWRDSAIVGAMLLGGGMGMVAFGEQTVPSGITALIIALMPVWVAVLGAIFLSERLPRLAIAGIILGFVGVAILIGPSAFGGAGALEPLGLAAILFSPISWSSWLALRVASGVPAHAPARRDRVPRW